MFKVIPQTHEKPRSKTPLLEVREILWGNTLTHIRHYTQPRRLSIGQSKNCDFISRYDKIERDRFYFIKTGTDNRLYLSFNKDMSGVVYFNANEKSFEALIKDEFYNPEGDDELEIPFKPGMAAIFRFGNTQYYLRFVDGEKLVRQPLYKQVEYTINTIMLTLLVAYLSLVTYIKSMPEIEYADILDVENRMEAPLLVQLLQKIEIPKAKPKAERYAKHAPQHVGEKGTIGKKDKLHDKTKGSARTRKEMLAEVNRAGLLGNLGESMEKMFGSGLKELDKHLGDLTGYSGADKRGTHGFGTIGAGRGGDGTSLGLGDGIVTYGLNQRDGSALSASEMKKPSGKASIKINPANVVGSMDKSEIARIMKKHYNQIRYCYQKELNRNPNLYGKITVRFIIGATGGVRSSVVKLSTMKNSNVEQCVNSVIRHIVFPAPNCGGQVHVSYPFVFNSEG